MFFLAHDCYLSYIVNNYRNSEYGIQFSEYRPLYFVYQTHLVLKRQLRQFEEFTSEVGPILKSVKIKGASQAFERFRQKASIQNVDTYMVHTRKNLPLQHKKTSRLYHPYVYIACKSSKKA